MTNPHTSAHSAHHAASSNASSSGSSTSGRGLVAVILAAGKGTRMQSDLPKVMHHAVGRPMVH
ncbi:MAG: hypothetical protein ACKO3W_13845 [bacterium]